MSHLSGFAVTEVWFAFINFIGDELHHPLDFFSNKMRTRQALPLQSLACYLISH